MPESFYAKITPVGPEGPTDPGFGHPGGGGSVTPPIYLPPSPWPGPPGHVELPIVLPPVVALPPFPTPPIVIEPPPDKPNPIPPGELWPPIAPEYAGKIVAVIVLGEGKVHWYHVPPPSVPGIPQPKR